MIFAFIIICFYLIVLSQERLPYDVTTANQVVFINSDDELSQALLLIDMLKTDYLKPLRNNSEVAAKVTAMVEESTSAATSTFLDYKMSGSTRNSTIATIPTTTAIEPHDENRDPTPIKGESARQSWHPPMVHGAPVFPLRWADLGTTWAYNYTMPLYNAPDPPRQQPRPVRLPLRPWRRFVPDYYFYDVHPRRFPKSPPIRRRERDRSSTLATTRATIAQKTATIERPTKRTKKCTPSTSSSKATSKSLRASNGRTFRHRTSKKATFHKKSSTYIEIDPVEAEVASELLKEFKQINITPKTKLRKTVAVSDSSTE